MAKPFTNHRDAALALLNGNFPLKPKEGQFLGQIAVDPRQLSYKQTNWLRVLLDCHGLPLLAEGGEQ